jgi:hypothetical protein
MTLLQFLYDHPGALFDATTGTITLPEPDMLKLPTPATTIASCEVGAYGDPSKPGEFLTMGDGSRWFHAYDGAAPVRMRASFPDTTPEADLEEAAHMLLCAKNEGDAYPLLCAMGRAGAGMPDGSWTTWARDYARRLLREKRIERWPSAATIIRFAMDLRDHYAEHTREVDAFKG